MELAPSPSRSEASLPAMTGMADECWLAERLSLAVPPVSPDMRCGQAAEMFQASPHLPALPVVQDGVPVALADRQTFLLHFAQRYGRDLYARRPVTHLADGSPLLVRDDTPIIELADRITREKPEALNRGFILVGASGYYAGIGQGIDLMRLTNEQMADALDRLRNTQQDLIEAEKMAALGGLVAGVAHEINTPLGVAVTAASALAKETRAVQAMLGSGTLRRADLADYMGSATEAADFILNNLGRAADLVTSFKQVAVDQTSDLPRSFDLGAYVSEVLKSLQPRLRRSPHRLVEQMCPGILVDSAPGAIAQIVTNLVMNALVHAFADDSTGTITVSVTAPADPTLAEVGVTDDGRGIPADVLPRIFDPFFTTKRNAGGTGLGLHLTYNLTNQRLKGRILVESRIGQGSRFTLRFPRRL